MQTPLKLLKIKLYAEIDDPSTLNSIKQHNKILPCN